MAMNIISTSNLVELFNFSAKKDGRSLLRRLEDVIAAKRCFNKVQMERSKYL